MATLALGERLRNLRVENGISLRELARRTDISPSFLSEVETGRSYPSEPVLERLANQLGVTAAGLRKLDLRSHVSELRELLEMDSSWGPVFQQIAKAGRSGKLRPEELLKRLGGK
jgi:transcriptional regulator with XRE-family HTH domain